MGALKEFLVTYGWVFIVILVALGALSYFELLSPELLEPELDFENKSYCIEWDGWIHLESMVYNCYDFEKQKIMCVYQIMLDDGTLRVYNIANGTGAIYNCSKYVNTIRIK